MIRWTTTAAALCLLASCGDERLGDGLPETITCTTCHGGETGPAPPVALDRSGDTASLGVGAHAEHLGTGVIRAALACTECHQVPASVDEPGHVDPLPAEVTFGTLATTGGLTPAWRRDEATCASTYCHGETLQGGEAKTPVWTIVDGSQSACGACHGAPPPPPHPASTSCHGCHPGTVRSTGEIDVPGGRHIDGQIDSPAASCSTCHGDETSPAPPVDTAGNAETSARGVGAHREHLGASSWHAEIGCEECHQVPATIEAVGHADTELPAELTWGSLARADGASPAFEPSDLTCSGTYCHGATLIPGGNRTSPVWTTVDGTQSACEACHGLPPAEPHPPQADCESCHDEVVAAGMTIVAPERHVDGIVDVAGGCGSCHENPPTVSGQDYPGGGGAHVFHVDSLGHACRTCHGHDGSGPEHNQGNAVVLPVNVDFQFDTSVSFPGGTTMTNGATPSQSHNGGNPTCSVGCHNPVPGDTADLANAAVWTDTSISCADCHERPGTEPPVNHDLDPDMDDDATVRASCEACHDVSSHAEGNLVIADPDASDGDSYAGSELSGLCRTCHDGGPGSFFGGFSPEDKSAFWTTAAVHEDLVGLDCDDCHDHHGRASGTVLVNQEEDLCAVCHAEVSEMNDASTPTHHHVVDSEQTGSQPLECVTCHDPHIVQKNPWRPITNPDTGALWPANDVPHDYDDGAQDAFNDTRFYCLTCHDGSWQGAKNVAAELANEDVINTGFRKENENLHRAHREKIDAPSNQMPCTYCHNVHGNTGTAGINRGALLHDWIEVTRHPYRGKNSCSTSDSLDECH